MHGLAAGRKAKKSKASILAKSVRSAFDHSPDSILEIGIVRADTLGMFDPERARLVGPHVDRQADAQVRAQGGVATAD